MASYLATVQIGRYELLELAHQPGEPACGAARPAAAQLAGRTSAGQPRDDDAVRPAVRAVPASGVPVVVTDDELEIPLEAQGISVFGANHMDGRRGYERLVAHELAHQWFGNSVTVRSWQHIWLNEGFACYAEWLWSEDSGGPSADRLARRRWQRLAGLPQDLHHRRSRTGADVRRPALQAGGADAARAAPGARAMTASSTCCGTGPSRHRHSTVTTEDVHRARRPVQATSRWPVCSTRGSSRPACRRCRPAEQPGTVGDRHRARRRVHDGERGGVAGTQVEVVQPDIARCHRPARPGQ